MKLKGKRVWYLLGAGIFIIALVGIGIAYMGQVQAQNGLNEELRSAQAKLGMLTAQKLAQQKADLETRLTATAADIKSDKARLNVPIAIDDIYDEITSMARETGLEITAVSSPGEKTTQIEKLKMSALPVTISVKGQVTGINAFITKVLAGYPTGVVEKVDITVPDTPDIPTATIDITMNAYRGE